MRSLFIIVAVVLLVCGIITRVTEPEMQSDVPVLYWVTDPNPARIEQIRLFHEWLVKNGYTTPEGRPCVELRLDTANNDGSKKIIQGVSGVAGDIMDAPIPSFQPLGILADVTDDARRLGFDMSATYAALEPNLTVDGRQYGFPCNVNVVGLWANVDTFRKAGMEPPPRTWDFQTFERIGKEFVKRANPPEERQTAFFSNSVNGWQGERWLMAMYRSLGLSMYNETMTRCTLDDERYARVLGLVHKWTFEDHILPSAADEASFSSESGYGGSMLSLFQNGNYAMISIGRWCLIRIREFREPPRLSVSAFPFEGFANLAIHTRTATVYAGSSHRDKAALFLAFLASEEYNANIVRDADALPPSPKYTRIDAYRRPPDHRNEWGCHEVPSEFSETIAIAFSYSPFVSSSTANRLKTQGIEKLMSNIAAPREVAREIAERINAEIQRTVVESDGLRRKYEEAVALQRKIDRYRKDGKKVPLAWLKNPFHRRYYVDRGWVGGPSS